MSINESIVYRQIPQYPEYVVGSDGSIRYGGKLLKPVRRSEYLAVNIHRNQVWRQEYIHRLVMFAFVGPCPDGLQCRHLDGNHDNNSVINLTWGTPKENMADAAQHGTRIIGERVGTAKLVAVQVLEIRELATEGWSHNRLARHYGVRKQTIASIIIGITGNTSSLY